MTDTQLPRARSAVQWLLRAGLALAALLMLAGLVVRLAGHHVDAPGVPLGSLTGELPLGDRLMALGILALGLTPGLRVIMLLVVWARERDWRFVGVAAVVLALLAIALAAGGG